MGIAEVGDRDHGDGGEGVVDMEEVEFAGLPAGVVERLSRRADRGGGERGRLVGVAGMGDDPRHRLEAEPVGDALAGDHHRCGAVGD